MRTLFVNHTSRISGGELSLLTLLSALPASVEPSVACPEGDLSERLKKMGIRVLPIRGTDGSLRLHPTRTPRALCEMGGAALQVRSAAKHVGADLVHANSIRAGIIAMGNLGGGPPIVVHVRDCLPGGAVSRLTLHSIARADALIANSEYTRLTLGPGASRARVVHNAVDLERFEGISLTKAEARSRLGLDERDPCLAVVAQITPWKGQADAIQIAQRLVVRHPRLQLLLVGSAKFDSASTRFDNAAYLGSLRRQVSDAGLSTSVQFLGEREDVPEILRALDLLLVPSSEEPFGRTVIEAMAAGVPVVATDVGGPPEILGNGNQGCGLVLPPGKPEVWSTAIKDLLDDRERMAEMARRGRSSARSNFGPKRHAAAVIEVYEEVTGMALE